MTLLSRKADYALLIMSHLSRAAAGGTARAIAERFGLSRAFVANILKQLCHTGFVTSHRGVNGGYTLHPGAAQVSVAALLEAIDERFRLTVCSTSGHADPCGLEGDCPVKGPLADIHRRLIGVLDGVTLGDLFGPTARPARTVLELLPSAPARSCGPIAEPVTA